MKRIALLFGLFFVVALFFPAEAPAPGFCGDCYVYTALEECDPCAVPTGCGEGEVCTEFCICEPTSECGDCILSADEECDPCAVPTGCGEGEVCTDACICEPTGGEGCTPGYWRNHLEDWPPTGYSPDDIFDSVFGTSYFSPTYTLDDAIWQGGGGVNRLARHGTAALLSSAHPDVDYPYTVAEVIAFVQAGDADPLAQANELGCYIN